MVALLPNSVGRFLLAALLPVGRRVNTLGNVAQVASVLAATLGLPALSAKVGSVRLWPFGVLIGLAVLVAVLFIAGVRLELEKARGELVSIKFEAFSPPQGEEALGVEWVQQIRVTNLGPPSHFTAVIGSDVKGLASQNYGAGTELAWEQTAEKEKWLGHGQTTTIRMATFAANRSGDGTWIRFWIPPSPYSGTQYGVGSLETAPSREISFELHVRDVKRDVVRARKVHVTCDPSGKP